MKTLLQSFLSIEVLQAHDFWATGEGDHINPAANCHEDPQRLWPHMATCCRFWHIFITFITLILRVLEAVAQRTCFFHVRTANTSVEVRSLVPQ